MKINAVDPKRNVRKASADVEQMEEQVAAGPIVAEKSTAGLTPPPLSFPTPSSTSQFKRSPYPNISFNLSFATAQLKKELGQLKVAQFQMAHEEGCSCESCGGIQMKMDAGKTAQLQTAHEEGCACEACGGIQMKQKATAPQYTAAATGLIQTKEGEGGPDEMNSIDRITADVYKAIKGIGTDEILLIEALSRLDQDQSKIDAFVAHFETTYGYDPIAWIQAELSNNFYDGDIEDLANRLLNIKADEKLSEIKENKTAKIRVKKNLNVRSNPDSSSKDNIVRKLPNGAVVEVIGEQEGWLQIGAAEWISSAYADVSTEQTVEYDEEAIKALAEAAYHAMAQIGTDETALLNTLAQLENQSDVIEKFKQAYIDEYGEDIEERIDAELNDGWTDAKYYIAAMKMLGVEVRENEKEPDAPDEEDGEKKELHNENVYIVKDKKAIIRDENGNYDADNYEIIPKWTTVKFLESKEVIPEGKTKPVTNAKVTYKDGEEDVIKWTSMGNLYEQFWDQEAHKEEYEEVDQGYAEAMLGVDTEATRAAKIMSGPGVKDVVDQFYPNSNELSSLSSAFQPKISGFIDFLAGEDITATVAAALRHPLRSLVFHSAILAAKNKEGLMKAQAQSIKYSLPIDWLHYNDDGTLNVATSKAKAVNVKGQFGIGSAAARGVKDCMGGTYSNHNFGNAVDMSLSFNFSGAEKTIEKDGKSYVINKANETPEKVNGKWVLANCGNKPLAKLGKEAFGVTRALTNDAIHWSETGG